jgi:hypothetical protein|tara:strand:- start:526 stop:648 length:123 start_codon:yes stop_codon:yes gene_type:complete
VLFALLLNAGSGLLRCFHCSNAARAMVIEKLLAGSKILTS